MQTVLRKIALKDNAQVESLIRDVMTEMGACGEGFAIHDLEVKDMFGAYVPPRAVYFVIEQAGLILGGGGISPLVGAEGICELRKMYFRPELRGKGWGKKLLRLCLQQATEMGYQKCYLETLTSMTSAQALYKSEGFKALCSPLGSTGHFGCDTWYVKSLA